MASKVSIANRALARLGAGQITSFADDNARARAVSAAYDAAREEVLRLHPWNCVSTRAELPAHSSDPAFGFERQYVKPSDCLYVSVVFAGDGETPSDAWTTEGIYILSDEGPPLQVKYVKDDDDPNHYDSLLRSALAAKLALEIAGRVTQSAEYIQIAAAWWEEVKDEAYRIDGMENSVNEFTEDPWITARFGGGL